MACALARQLRLNISAAAANAHAMVEDASEVRLFWWHRFRGMRRSFLKPEAFSCGHGLRCLSDSRAAAFARANAVVVWVGSRPQANCMPPRLPAHLWVVEYSESPSYYPVLQHESFMNQFDLKVSHELNSDIVLTALHPMVEGGPIVPSKWLPRRVLTKRAVVWLASNCASRNAREELVRRLASALHPTLPLHSIGKCLHTHSVPELSLQPEHDRTMDTWISKARVLAGYAFCLITENSIAHHYVTEKLFHAFAAGCLPIYYGTATVDPLLPHPRSIVRVLDFCSMESLAHRLLALSTNATLYHSHVAWRDDDALVRAWWQRMQTLTAATRTANRSALFCEYCRVVQRTRRASLAAGGQRIRKLAPSPRPDVSTWDPLLRRGIWAWLPSRRRPCMPSHV